jgi:chorismate mutase
MKRGIIFNLKPVLEKFLSKEMGMDSALKLIDFSAKFSEELTALEQKRITLVKKYGEVKEDGNTEVLDETKKEKFKKAFEKALAEDIEFELLDVADFASLKMTPSEASTFKSLFK